MQGYSEDVVLQLPKFEVESSFPKLADTLKDLGVIKIFQNIDCNNTLGKHLFVSKIIQKTFIKVDEQGTEAAAITAIFLQEQTSKQYQPPPPKQINCNHPFWFLLLG